MQLTIEQCASAHAWLRKEPSAFDQLIARSRELARTTKVQWGFPVTSATVHQIEAVYLIARDEGFGFQLETSAPLSDREQAFVDDFARHCLGARDGAATETLGVSDYVAAARESFEAFSRSHARRRPQRPFPGPMATVTIIGAYGGDHVGDAAILGGVLLTLNRLYGTTSATVMSHRPEHTRRLAAGLETAVSVNVVRYSAANTDKALAASDGLILAGGPVMDLPRVLMKHLSAAYKARSLGLPFLVDRVGVGPFKRDLSRKLAARLMGLATTISVRSNASGEDSVLDGMKLTVASDPAFDYLATRSKLSRVTPAEAASIDELLSGTQGRQLIGLNIRPIRHSWAAAGADFARDAETRFTEKLAEAMVEIDKALPTSPVFVFFPMNPIQFGMSDLLAAYRIQKLLGGRADMRVWQADPDVDGVLALLRRLDAVVAMRLHACIFSFSQGLPLLGVDYYPGQGGKVEQLFKDQNHATDVRRIDNFDGSWMVSSLLAKLEGRRSAPIRA